MSTIFFSQIREDSLVEKEISAQFQPKKIVVIGSGGCTAFSVVDDYVDKVLCVDMNPAQCALIELKKQAINSLNREEYLAFIGEKKDKNRNECYLTLSEKLPANAKNFWDKNIEGIKQGINQCGVTEQFYRFIGGNVCNNVYSKDIWTELFTSSSLKKQQEFYEQYLTTPEWKTTVKLLLSKTTHLQFFPKYMFEHASENDFGDFFSLQFEKEIKTKRVHNNYFLSQILLTSYLFDQENGMPFYLTNEGYDMTKRNIEKIVVYPGSLQTVLKTQESVDAYYLSNVFDWANETERNEICEAILRSKSREAIFLSRNMLSVQQLPEFFEERFQINSELSKRCMELERSMLYQKITVGTCI